MGGSRYLLMFLDVGVLTGKGAHATPLSLPLSPKCSPALLLDFLVEQKISV